MGHLKTQGKRVGKIPYGYDLASDGETLTPNKAEQAVIAQMVEMDASMSLRQIAKALTLKGIKAKGGRDWHPESVRLVIKRASLKVAA